jgi:hypothetical protein
MRIVLLGTAAADFHDGIAPAFCAGLEGRMIAVGNG